MFIAVVFIALGALLLYGSVGDYDIKSLIFGKQIKNSSSSSGSAATGGTTDSTAASTSAVTTNPRSPGAVVNTAYVSPIAANAQYERIDQGVDYSQSTPYLALGSGVVEQISTGWRGGTGQAVYVKLDNPITVNGRTYSEYYVAEVSPLVQAGRRVIAGQKIAAGGAAELGFLINGSPTPVSAFGAGTPQTTAGKDFFQFLQSLANNSTVGNR